MCINELLWEIPENWIDDQHISVAIIWCTIKVRFRDSTVGNEPHQTSVAQYVYAASSSITACLLLILCPTRSDRGSMTPIFPVSPMCPMWQTNHTFNVIREQVVQYVNGDQQIAAVFALIFEAAP